MAFGRRLAKVAAVLTVTTTVLSGFAYATLKDVLERGNTVDLESRLTNRPTPSIGAEAGDPLNIVVIGSDTREGQGSGFGGASHLGSQRSDTVILVHLSGDRQWATAVSIPRDTTVDMPDCIREDGSISKGWRGDFNVNYARAGAACTITAIEQITGLYINHYIEVDFKGFKRVVNAVGGVDVCLTEAVNDKKSHLKLPAGWSTLDGKQAIAFVRARKTLGDGSDISRIRRQQDFMASLAKKIISAETLLNPGRLLDVIGAVTENLTTDPGLGTIENMSRLAIDMSDLRPNRIRFVTAPIGADPDDWTNVVLTPKAEELWAALRADQPWPLPPDLGYDGKELTRAPEDIDIRVANATATKGLAGEKAKLFEQLGYGVEKVLNADAKFGKATAVYASADKANAARTVAAALGLKEVLPLPKGVKAGVVVIVGTDWKDPKELRIKPPKNDSLYGPTEGRAADETTCSPA